MKISVDADVCIGSGSCARYAPETFTTDDAGLVVLLEQPWDDADTVALAVSACPVAALEMGE